MSDSIDIDCHASLRCHLFGTEIINDAAAPDDERMFNFGVKRVDYSPQRIGG